MQRILPLTVCPQLGDSLTTIKGHLTFGLAASRRYLDATVATALCQLSSEDVALKIKALNP